MGIREGNSAGGVVATDVTVKNTLPSAGQFSSVAHYGLMMA